jgi:hypothetical protein
MSDSDITMRKDMKEESSYKLISAESHNPLLIAIGIIAPSEGNLSVMEPENAVIADSDPVGVSSEVLKDSVDACKWRLTIDDPFFVIEPSSEDLKVTCIFEMTDTAGKDQLLETIF